MLNDTHKSRYFRRFLQKEHCTENLDFYRACQAMESLFDELEARDMPTRKRWATAKEEAMKLMELYIEPDSPLQVRQNSCR